jgi:hypothetical protein
VKTPPVQLHSRSKQRQQPFADSQFSPTPCFFNRLGGRGAAICVWFCNQLNLNIISLFNRTLAFLARSPFMSAILPRLSQSIGRQSAWFSVLEMETN